MPISLDRRAFLKRSAEAVGAGLAIPLLAACGGAAAPASSAPAAAPATASGAAKPAASAAAAASPSAAAKGLTKVTYAFASVNPYHWVATLAKEKPELAAKYGVEFDLVTTTNSPNAVNALVGGSAHVAVTTPDSIWPAQDKAPDVKQLFAVADGTPYALLAQPEIKRAAEMKGKTFGASAVKGGADTTAIMMMMLENGVKPTDYTIVQAGDVAQRTSAMKANAIQAIANLEPQATLLREAGFPEIDNANNYPVLKGVHTIIASAKKSWADSEVAVNFVRAWVDITKWMYDPKNKDELLAVSKKPMGSNDAGMENAYKLNIGQKSVSPDIRINEKYMLQFIDNLKKTGAENLPTDPTKYVDNSLVDRVLKG